MEGGLYGCVGALFSDGVAGLVACGGKRGPLCFHTVSSSGACVWGMSSKAMGDFAEGCNVVSKEGKRGPGWGPKDLGKEAGD